MTGKVNKCILNGNIQIAFSSTIITDCGQVSRASRGYDKPEPPAIHDDLKARVLLVKSDKKEMVLISCDFGGFDLYEINKIKEQIKRIGISPCNVTIFCSHTHAGFDKINSGKIGEKLANIIKKSRKNMVSASVGFLEVNAGTGININRRVVLPDGYGVFCIMYNTDCTIGSNKLNCTKQVRKQFEALGLDCRKANILKKPVYTDRPVDTTLNAIYFKDDKGKLLGSFVRFSGHACVVSSKHIGNRISADYVGYLCRKVEKELGGICLFGNGPSGDIRMLYRENTFKEAERFGNLLAGKGIDNFKKTDYRPLVSCGVIQKEVDFPVNKKLRKTVEAGKEKSEYLKKEILQRTADRKDIRGIKPLYDEKYYIESKTRLFSREFFINRKVNFFLNYPARNKRSIIRFFEVIDNLTRQQISESFGFLESILTIKHSNISGRAVSKKAYSTQLFFNFSTKISDIIRRNTVSYMF